MTHDFHDDELDALLRKANPWPVSRAVDPALAERASARLEQELTMTTDTNRRPTRSRRPRRRTLVAVIALVAVTIVGGIVVGKTRDDEINTATGSRALGSAFASCLEFSLETLGKASVAFDGTVTGIDNGRVTFDVEHWYRGGEGNEVTVGATNLISGAPELEGGVGFVDGERYLVSGERQNGELVPAICGLTVEYDSGLADDWERAFS